MSGSPSGSPAPKQPRKTLGDKLAWAGDVRTRWWEFLDSWEEDPRFRRKVLGIGIGASALIAVTAVAYPMWRERAAVKMATTWLSAGNLPQAEAAISHAFAVAPKRPEVWRLAAEHASRVGRKKPAVAFARQAATLAGNDIDVVLDWASFALIDNDLVEAAVALGKLPAGAEANSARAQRLFGELDRRNGKLDTARAHFELAVKLGGSSAINEVPLGAILLDTSSDETRRAAGVALLKKWTADPEAGAEALRLLLLNAVQRGDEPSMVAFGDELWRHPVAGVDDRLNALLALSSVPERQAQALVGVEVLFAKDPAAAASLISWLSGNGRGVEAVRWARTLPREIAERPPVIVTVADALRLSEDWPALRVWVEGGDWEKLKLVRLAYRWVAAKNLSETHQADEVWSEIRDVAKYDGGQALFIGGTLYAWGYRNQGVDIWTIAAGSPGVAVTAFGSLARHYQLRHDAEGLQKAFAGLRAAKLHDPLVGNNFAYLSLLVGTDEAVATRVARENFEKFPDNNDYRVTYAFALSKRGDSTRALEILKPVVLASQDQGGELPSSLAFTYGYVLSRSGQKKQARDIIKFVDRAALTMQEAQVLKDIEGGR